MARSVNRVVKKPFWVKVVNLCARPLEVQWHRVLGAAEPVDGGETVLLTATGWGPLPRKKQLIEKLDHQPKLDAEQIEAVLWQYNAVFMEPGKEG